ncbi:MAG: histidinol-phosphate transaminase [Proteobacteria bacterium]|nr:histidinol-phosphate transaminase [Pseudomonadota bacterium]
MAVRAQRPLIRPLVQRLHAYVPGEQPKIPGLIKLNTNENPYPPSPKVLAAVKAAVDGRLRLYPNPTAAALRERLAKLHGCAPENIIVGNGSDELLALATRVFVEPSTESKVQGPKSKAQASASLVQYFNPSYSLYPVLAEIAGTVTNPVPLGADFGLPALAGLAKSGWDFNAALSLVTTPNAPSGHGFTTAELDALCAKSKGIVVLDEAYVDFARENAMSLALKHSHVLVSRTFSKAYSLCFQRVGYFVGHADLIAALDKVRDSYNVNGLGQVAALATLDDLPYYRRNFQRIIATREQVTAELTGLGWAVLPSQTNFLLARPTRYPAEEWLAKLRAQKLLVRWFKYPEVRDYLRITIGSEPEMEVFVKTVRKLGAGK